MRIKELARAVFPFLMSLRSSLSNYSVRIRNFGKHVCICSKCELSDVEFGPYVYVAHHAQIGNSTIGARSSIGRYSKLRRVNMGKYCSVSWDVTIGAAAHALDHVSTHMFWHLEQFGISDTTSVSELEDPVIVGNDVWLGCCSVIKSGVSIGNGAVVGANAFVDKDVPPYAIVAGSPARVLRYRFSEDVCDVLQRLAWWDWDDEYLRDHLELFQQSLPESISKNELLSLLRERKIDVDAI